jgi:ribosomal protein S18 acetylase RimI-like enzyme
MPDIDELLALDLLTLREHTERAGDRLDAGTHRALLARTLAQSETIVVRRGGALAAYAMLSPQADDCWFVSGFNTHPAHRDASVMRELFAGLSSLARRRAVAALRSHVYKTNRLSLAFHRRLGFRVTRENAKAIEFTATPDELLGASRVAREAGTRAAGRTIPTDAPAPPQRAPGAPA